MNDYLAVMVYAGCSLIVFGFAMAWRVYRDRIMKRFHLLNYHPKDPKNPHQAAV
jgi:hypothetical protein